MRSSRDGTWRRRRLASARLYLCAGAGESQAELELFLERALLGGVDLIQLRDKQASEAALRTSAAVFRVAALRHDALFILNDDPHLAVDVDADGVHVGQDDMPPAQARDVVGRERLIGRSTHSRAEVDRALTEDCDYFAVGPVHATPTKQGRPGTGLAPISHAAAVADRPWYVTGGMAPGTAPEVLAAGARGLVVVRALTEAADPQPVAADLSRLLRAAG